MTYKNIVILSIKKNISIIENIHNRFYLNSPKQNKLEKIRKENNNKKLKK